MICPMKATLINQNSHLLNLVYNLFDRSFSNTNLRWFSCSSFVLENTIMSSMKTTINLSNYSINTLFMRYMKEAGAFVSPNDITIYSYSPYQVWNVVFGISDSRIFS
jgi:hypothetical protein